MKILHPNRCTSEIGEEHDESLKKYINFFFFFTTITCLEHNIMSLDQYNQLMSNMLNERYALAKLRAELEEREGRLCRHCRRFGHVAQKCRSEKEETKKAKPQNRFEMLKSQVM